MTEGTVTRWLVEVGDTIELTHLVEVSTDKVDTEVPSPVAGVVEQILVPEDEDVEVGAALAIIGDGSGAAASCSPQLLLPSSRSLLRLPQHRCCSGCSAAGSAYRVLLPHWASPSPRGTVTRWLKEVGEQVELTSPG